MGSLFLLWASDTGAYFAGVNLDKQSSLNGFLQKSRGGSIGGAIAALITAFIISMFFDDLDPWHWHCIAIIIVIAGTYGDLVESLFKRSIAIKDSEPVYQAMADFWIGLMGYYSQRLFLLHFCVYLYKTVKQYKN
jgi:phosphatidate cytidylyltransferase